MEQNNHKCFELFRQWLEATRPKSASELTSNLRSLEPCLTGVHCKGGRAIGEIHSLYGKLSAAENYSSREVKKVVSEVKTEIGDCYHNITDPERRKQNGLSGCTTKKIGNYKTAFIALYSILGIRL